MSWGEAEFIRQLAQVELSEVVTADELVACLQKTRDRWGETPRVDQELVLAMIASMANEARSITCH